jgi:anaerobic magnesium-protoporphyrin IX monomethyl ester cyclase
MRILLYIPIFIDVTAPLLGIPSLVAHLKKNGYNDIIVKDLNLEILDYLANSDYLDNQAKRVIRDFEHLNNLQELTVETGQEYEKLVNLYIFCQLNLYRKLEEYLYMLRDPERFYDVSYYMLNIKSFFDNCFQLMNFKNSLDLDYLFASPISGDISDNNELIPGFYQSKVLPGIEELQPDIIGISVCYSSQYQPTVYLTRLIKERFPAVHIVIGGTHLNVLKNRHLSTEKEYFSAVDSYLLGEGEIPFLALLKELEGSGDLSKVPNLIYCLAGNITVNESVDGLPVNELPVPDFTCLPLENYLAPETVLPYRVARGCYWNQCAFCVHFQTRDFSFKKPGQVFEEIKALKEKFHTGYFYFVDDSVPKAFLEKFLGLIEKENLKINWVINIRCEPFLTGDFIKRLSQCGCRQLYLGIESGSQQILDIIKKGIKIDTVEQIINHCHKYAIAVKMNFIKGLPHEDKQDIEDTINFIKRTAKNSDIIALTPLGIGENTDIARDSQHFGVEILDKKDPARLFLSFRRTRGLISFAEIDRLYDQHTDIFDRFTFFNRVHHFLYSLKFSKKEFEALTPRLFLISDNVENYLLRDISNLQIDMEKKPVFKNNHQPQVFNYHIKQVGEMTAEPLSPRQTIYLYSLLNYEILADISPFTYQFLVQCTGQKNINQIIEDFKSKYPGVDPGQLETQTINNIKYLCKYKVIDIT